jgi:hypothetical protein
MRAARLSLTPGLIWLRALHSHIASASSGLSQIAVLPLWGYFSAITVHSWPARFFRWHGAGYHRQKWAAKDAANLVSAQSHRAVTVL